MSWERGNQLQTTAPSRGANQSYMDRRLASRASSDSSMPLGSPVLPEVNCTNRPGASYASGNPPERQPLEGRRGHRTKGEQFDQTGVAQHTVRAGDARTCARSGPRTRSPSMPRAGCGSDTSVMPERSAPKKTARQSCDAVNRAATVPARPARCSSHAPALRAWTPSSCSVSGREPSDRQWTRACRATGRIERVSDEAHARATVPSRRTEPGRTGPNRAEPGRTVGNDRAGTLVTSDGRTRCNSTSMCRGSRGRAAPKPSGRRSPTWRRRPRQSGCERSQ